MTLCVREKKTKINSYTVAVPGPGVLLLIKPSKGLHGTLALLPS